MQAIFETLEFILTIVFLAGVVAAIRPYGPIKTRARAAIVIVAALVGSGIIGPFLPHPPPSKSPPAAGAAPGQQGASTAAAADPATKPETPITPEVKASFLKTQASMMEAVKTCDLALAKATKTHGQYASYGISNLAHQACQQASKDLNGLHFNEPLPRAARDDLDKGLDCFSLAYAGEAMAMGEAASMLDSGDMRPSKVAEFSADLKDSVGHHNTCKEAYTQAALIHGFAAEVGWAKKD